MEMNQVTESEQSEDEEEMDVEQAGDVDEEMMSEQPSDVDFDINNSASAILLIIKNSPVKKRGAKYLMSVMSNKLNKFTDEEKLDILVVLAHSDSDDIKTLLKEKGIDIVNIPRKTKRTSFSDLCKSTKHWYKDELKS